MFVVTSNSHAGNQSRDLSKKAGTIRLKKNTKKISEKQISAFDKMFTMIIKQLHAYYLNTQHFGCTKTILGHI